MTLGPKGKDSFEIAGEAAHIYGATMLINGKGSSRIPRPAPKEIDENYIKSLENGIWLCRHHHRLIDSIWGEKEHTPEQLKQWKEDGEKRQEERLKIKEHETIKKFFEKIPSKLGGGTVPVNKFTSTEWAIILYADNTSNMFRRDYEDFSFAEYVEWITENNMRPNKVGIEKDAWDRWFFADQEKVINNLSGVISFPEGYTQLKRGKHYYSIIADLKKIDADYKELMIEEMSVDY